MTDPTTRRPNTPRRLLTGDAGWSLLDQVVSSGTNFGLMLVTVRSVDVAAFGAFSLVYAVYVFVIPLLRATATVPLTVRHASSSTQDRQAAVKANLRYAFSVGLLLGVACLLVAVVVPGQTRTLLAVLGVAFPLLLVQDAARGAFFLRSEFRRATLNDAVWAAVQFTALAALLVSDRPMPVTWFLVSWAGAGAAAGLVGLVQLAASLRLVSPLVWLRDHGTLARPLFLTMLFTVAPAQLVYLFMPAVSTLAELGRVRGAYVLFGPLNVAFTAASAVALPRTSRLGRIAVRGAAARLTLLTGGLAATWALTTTLLPASVGRHLLPGLWDSTGTVRMLLALSLIAEGVMVGPTVALPVFQLPERLARVRYWSGPMTLALGLLLAAWRGADGVAAAFLVGYTLAAVAAWTALPTGRARHVGDARTRRHRRKAGATGGGPRTAARQWAGTGSAPSPVAQDLRPAEPGPR